MSDLWTKWNTGAVDRVRSDINRSEVRTRVRLPDVCGKGAEGLVCRLCEFGKFVVNKYRYAALVNNRAAYL